MRYDILVHFIVNHFKLIAKLALSVKLLCESLWLIRVLLVFVRAMQVILISNKL